MTHRDLVPPQPGQHIHETDTPVVQTKLWLVVIELTPTEGLTQYVVLNTGNHADAQQAMETYQQLGHAAWVVPVTLEGPGR